MSQKSKSQSAGSPAKTENKEPVIPASIAEFTAIAKSIAGVKDVPENMLAVQTRLADGCIKLAERITKGLGAAAKKAEREAKAKARAEAKAKRDKERSDKKLAKIAKLREQLKDLEGDES